MHGTLGMTNQKQEKENIEIGPILATLNQYISVNERINQILTHFGDKATHTGFEVSYYTSPEATVDVVFYCSQGSRCASQFPAEWLDTRVNLNEVDKSKYVQVF